MQRSCPSKTGGSRECRVRAAPAVSCAKLCENAHEHTGSAETLRHSPRNGFTAYGELSPVTNSSCHRHRRIGGFARPGWADQNLRRFDTSNGCQDHTLLPYASASFVLRAGHRSRETRPATPFRADAAASNASSPAFRDDRDTPLVSRKSDRMCERAVDQNRPLLELSPDRKSTRLNSSHRP